MKSQLMLLLCALLCIQLTFGKDSAADKSNSIVVDDSQTFDGFKNKFGKKYSNSEENSARKIAFDNNVKKWKESGCTACGITSLFDLTDAQLEQMRGLKIDEIPTDSAQATVPDIAQEKSNGNSLRSEVSPVIGQVSAKSSTSSSTDTTTPTVTAFSTAIIDWRIQGAVTPVKNQASCGSCWAFATTAFFESELVIKLRANNTVDLAEEFLLTCDTSSSGCNGGSCSSASRLAISKGLPSQVTYPYNYSTTYAGICTATPDFTFSTNSLYSYYSSTKLTDSQIIAYLTKRPVMVYVGASSWYTYAPTSTSRTFSCSTTYSTSTSQLNHAVLLVGYTSTEWIIKNSWGPSWGSSGYIYVTRSRSNNCGIGYFLATLA